MPPLKVGESLSAVLPPPPMDVSYDPPSQPIYQVLIDTVLNVGRFTLTTIPHVAQVINKLSRRIPFIDTFIDSLIEDIRHFVEANDPSMRQVRTAQMVLLSCLANLGAVSSGLVFDTLYMLFSIGHSVDERGVVTSLSDPPYDHFRIRLILTLFKVCVCLCLLRPFIAPLVLVAITPYYSAFHYILFIFFEFYLLPFLPFYIVHLSFINSLICLCSHSPLITPLTYLFEYNFSWL